MLLPQLLFCCLMLLILITVFILLIGFLISEIFGIDSKKSKLARWLKNKIEIKD